MIGAKSSRRRQVKGERTLVKESGRCLAPRVPESRSSLAIVLRWRAYGESDKIATLLTEDFGKLTGIAKGAKNSRRRFANSLEPLARVRVHFRQKPTANLAFLESCELRSSTAALSDPTRFAYASYVAELADQLTLEDDPVREPVRSARRGARRARARSGDDGVPARLRAAAPHPGRLRAPARRLHALRPDLARTTSRSHLSFSHGTVTCTACRRDEDAGVAVDPALLAPPGGAEGAAARRLPRPQRSGGWRATPAQVTGRLLALHLARPLRSVKLIEQLAAPGP